MPSKVRRLTNSPCHHTDILFSVTNSYEDVAFDVENVDAIFQQAAKRGASVISAPETISDQYGSVRTATIRTYGDTTHTLVNRSAYSGAFLPGYRSESAQDPIASYLPEISLEAIDHCVGNMDWDGMEAACQ